MSLSDAFDRWCEANCSPPSQIVDIALDASVLLPLARGLDRRRRRRPAAHRRAIQHLSYCERFGICSGSHEARLIRQMPSLQAGRIAWNLIESHLRSAGFWCDLDSLWQEAEVVDA